MSGQTGTPERFTGTTGISPGDVIADKYQIDQVLGVGGMGTVFLARHLELDGQVALKFLSAECLSNQQAIGRFRREAQAAVKLRNEHVVRVFDVGTHRNGLPYIVMEYLEGVDLAALLAASGLLPVERAADMLIQTCEALTEAHEKGIVHRDLKPSNLFCLPRSDGGVTIKVVDFGISKVSEAMANFGHGLTTTGNVMGSPSYMSPEQMKTPNRVDQRTDLWSLGVVLYEALTGQFPFPASTYAEICLRVHQDPPVPPRAHRPDLPEGLEAVILKCLAKDPDLRFARASDLALALAPFAQTGGRSFPSLLPIPPAGTSPDRATPLRPPSGNQTLTVAAPNWEQSTVARPRHSRPKTLLIVAGLMVPSLLVAVWFAISRSDSPHSSSAGSPSAVVTSQATVLVPESPPTALPEQGPALPAAPVVAEEENALAPQVSPAPSPPARAATAPTSAARAAARSVVTPAPHSTVPSTHATAAASARGTKPHTERDPKSSTWTR